MFINYKLPENKYTQTKFGLFEFKKVAKIIYVAYLIFTPIALLYSLNILSRSIFVIKCIIYMYRGTETGVTTSFSMYSYISYEIYANIFVTTKRKLLHLPTEQPWWKPRRLQAMHSSWIKCPISKNGNSTEIKIIIEIIIVFGYKNTWWQF